VPGGGRAGAIKIGESLTWRLTGALAVRGGIEESLAVIVRG
jgi:hypothetical protein